MTSLCCYQASQYFCFGSWCDSEPLYIMGTMRGFFLLEIIPDCHQVDAGQTELTITAEFLALAGTNSNPNTWFPPTYVISVHMSEDATSVQSKEIHDVLKL